MTHPGEERDSEERPLHAIQHAKKFDWVLNTEHRRLQSRDSSGQVASSRHALPWGTTIVLRARAIVGVLG